ncbi:MAG: SdrD B-like domain-containing protein, partial [Ferruginibacter sp.]
FNLLAQCSCSGNMVSNPSFENGYSQWDYTGGNLNSGTGATVCGSKSGDFEITNNSNNRVYQTIGTNLQVGTVLNALVWAGTHDNSYTHQVALNFYDANWNLISSSFVSVDKVLADAPAGPQLYTWSGVVPAGCKFTQVSFNGDGSWIKTDMWCVTRDLTNTVSLGNTVFIDVNGNGKFDSPDWGYDGVTVRLYEDNNDDGIADGAAVATRTTAGGGVYNFTGLQPGKYFVQLENVPSWMYKSVPNGGDPDNDIDNDNNGLTQNTTTQVIKGGTIGLNVNNEPNVSNNSTYDFGIFKTNGLGDQVFLDADADGVQDAGEAGIAGVTVNLRNTSGALLATTTTDATGYYYFYDPIQYGTYNYNIEFITPAGYGASPSNQGSDDSKDSDPVNGIIVNAYVPDGTWDYSFDAGFYPLMAVGDRVYHDANNNGFREAAETGIAGVPVYLYRDANNDNVADGASIATATTNSTGNYLFNNLLPGNYMVGILPPANYYSSTVNGGDPDNNVDVDNNGITSDTTTREIRGKTITLSAFAEFDGTNSNTNTNITYDFGLVTGTLQLGDYVWHDVNRNGEQDAGEPGIPNQWVVLKSADKTGELRKIKTDANGYYLFQNMAPGNYFMKFPNLYHMIPTYERTGSNNNRNSKANAGGWAPVTLAAGDDMDIDAGYFTGWPLAVKDITLTPVLKGNKVEVTWHTIGETNSAYFEVERSYDGTVFEKIDKILSSVPNGGNASYKSTDAGFLTTATTLFYRIKMVDKEGKVSYSKIAVVKPGVADNITVWPNPFMSSVSFTYTTAKTTKLNVRLLDMNGRKIYEKQFTVNAGTNTITVDDLRNIPTGNYFMEWLDLNTANKQVKPINKQ